MMEIKLIGLNEKEQKAVTEFTLIFIEVLNRD